MKPTLFVAAVAAAVCIASSATANSRFTLENQTDGNVKVRIFNGGDGTCDFKLKSKIVSAGKSNSFGCNGDGHQRCKIQIRIDGARECTDKHNTCSNDATIIKNGQTIQVYKTGKVLNPYGCQLLD